MNRRTVLCGLAAAGLVKPAAAQGSVWPDRNIMMVVPFAAGGSTDIMARLLAERLGQELGQKLIIENRPGAASNRGAVSVARAAPDGYTLLVATSTLAANVALYTTMGFDLQKDLVPVSLLTRIPNVLVVNNDFPAKTLAEFIDHARRNPRAINYGSSGVGASQHLAGALFASMTQTEMVHVPYRGGSQANSDLLGGQIQAVFAPLVEVLPFIDAARLRPLAVTTKERSPRLPEVPTVAETLPGFEIVLWNGLFAPAGTPQPIVDRLAAEVRKVMADPAMQRLQAEQGNAVVNSTPAEFKLFLAAEVEKWSELVKLSGAKVE
jgi:tripartite-type tricarboxylate transporter receptor subunit TctC